MTPIVYFNGSYAPKDAVRVSPDDRGFLFADGVYEVLRAYRGTFFRAEAHLARLARGLAALRIAGVDPGAIGAACRELVTRNGLTGADALAYIQVTRGAAPRVHAFPDPPVPPTVYATVYPFAPKADPARGIAAITAPDVRWARCDLKTVGLLANCLANQRARECGATEAIFVRDGMALEGTATSFFGVLDGTVRTAPKSNYILPSITRDVVLELCAELGLPAAEQPISLEEVAAADELFVAGTTLEVMAIVQLDGRPVGDGQPGPVTRRLQDQFHALIARL